MRLIPFTLARSRNTEPERTIYINPEAVLSVITGIQHLYYYDALGNQVMLDDPEGREYGPGRPVQVAKREEHTVTYITVGIATPEDSAHYAVTESVQYVLDVLQEAN